MKAGTYGALPSWGTVGNCPSTTGGIDGTGGVYFAVLLCAGPNLGACTVSSASNNAIDITKNNWAVEGVSATAPGSHQAFFADYCSVSSPLHHVAFINDIAYNSGYGLNAGPCGNSHGGDYLGWVGNIVQNANAYTGGASFCGAAVDLVGPQNYDAVAGTHIFVSGNFVYANLGPTPHGDCTSDIEGIMLDTWDLFGYSQQAVYSNNIIYDNAGMGIQLFYQSKHVTSPTIKLYNNTLFGNNANIPVSGAFEGSEINVQTGASSWIISITNNIARTAAAKTGTTQLWAAYFDSILSTQTYRPTTSSNVLWGTATNCEGSCAPSSGQPIVASCCSSPAYLPGSNTYEDAVFKNTTDLLANWVGTPNCSAYTNTPACAGWNYATQSAASLTIIGDLTPTASGTSGKGYQPPAACAANADYPTWLKGIVYLQWNGSSLTEDAGLVTKPCNL